LFLFVWFFFFKFWNCQENKIIYDGIHLTGMEPSPPPWKIFLDQRLNVVYVGYQLISSTEYIYWPTCLHNV
jgi:hypothetical protein